MGLDWICEFEEGGREGYFRGKAIASILAEHNYIEEECLCFGQDEDAENAFDLVPSDAHAIIMALDHLIDNVEEVSDDDKEWIRDGRAFLQLYIDCALDYTAYPNVRLYAWY